ncbi:MAG: hypothetical protein IJ058_12885 [Lachnospiraceae bacterium]|nr:hypothetical protein [Lachnospiraceae bacterium]
MFLRLSMNSETYVECLVQTKVSPVMKFFRILLIMLCAAFAFLGLMGYIVALIMAIACGAGAYFVSMQCTVEYEYLYLDHEISIDRILGRSRRKRVASYEVDRMEVMAPMNSYHLDPFKNRDVKTKDFSSKVINQPDTRYAMYYEGNEMIVFEPNEDFVKAVYNVAPRKTFRD